MPTTRAAKAPGKPREATQTIHRLKITIRGLRPPVWRRIEVPSNWTLSKLHEAILVSMGWAGHHLHLFEAGDTSIGPMDLGEPFADRDERKVRLSQVLPRKGMKMFYEYDFGDGWQHDILLEEVFETDQPADFPRCVKGRRACPPDDCGGVWGYLHLLEVLGNPEDPEHKGLLEWVGGEIDPGYFDLEEANDALRQM